MNDKNLTDCELDTLDRFPSDKTECVRWFGATFSFKTKSDALNLLDVAVLGLEDDAETLVPHLRRNPHQWDAAVRRWQVAVLAARTHANNIANACSQAEIDRYLNPRVSRIRDAVVEAAEQICDELHDGDVCIVTAAAVAQQTRDWAERVLWF